MFNRIRNALTVLRSKKPPKLSVGMVFMIGPHFWLDEGMNLRVMAYSKHTDDPPIYHNCWEATIPLKYIGDRKA
jgi:hypothetical protein